MNCQTRNYSETILEIFDSEYRLFIIFDRDILYYHFSDINSGESDGGYPFLTNPNKEIIFMFIRDNICAFWNSVQAPSVIF